MITAAAATIVARSTRLLHMFGPSVGNRGIHPPTYAPGTVRTASRSRPRASASALPARRNRNQKNADARSAGIQGEATVAAYSVAVSDNGMPSTSVEVPAAAVVVPARVVVDIARAVAHPMPADPHVAMAAPFPEPRSPDEAHARG